MNRKHKKSSALLFVLSGLMIGFVLLLAIMPKPKTIDTPNDRATLHPSWNATYNQGLEESDRELGERFEQMESDLKKEGQTETDEESEEGQKCYETDNYKFYKAEPSLLPQRTSKILGVYDLEYDEKTGYYYNIYDNTYQSLFIGQLLTLFGSADYVTENNEELLSYVVAAEDEEGNVIYLEAYYGPSGPAIGGIAGDEAYENAAGELAWLIMNAEASDFELSSVYEDIGISLKMGVKDGQAYYDMDY